MNISENNIVKIALTLSTIFTNIFYSLFPDSINPNMVQDVPISNGEVQWLNPPKKIEITSCDVSAGKVKFALGRSFFIMTYHLVGELQGEGNSKPKIIKILASENFVVTESKNLVDTGSFFNKVDDNTLDTFEKLAIATEEMPTQNEIQVKLTNKNISADITIFPITEESYDPKYNSEPIPFDITVEKKTNLMQWNENLYSVTCGDFRREVRVDLLK